MNFDLIWNLEIPIGIAVIKYANEWEIETFNDEFCRLFDYAKDELLVQAERQQLIFDRDMYVFEEVLEHAKRDRSVVTHEIRIRKKDGRPLWVQARCTFLEYRNAVPYLMLVMGDIDKYKKSEIKLNLLNQQYEIMEEVANEVPFDLDVEKWKMLRSKRLMNIRGVTEAEDAYYPFAEEIKEIHPMDQDLFVKKMKEAARDELSGTVEIRYNIAAEGDVPKYAWFRLFYKSVMGEDSRVIRIIGRSYNVDKDVMLQDAVKRDPLTKLLNKVEVRKAVQELLNSAQHQTHIMFVIDIDNFKQINDTFGHTYGDNVVSEVASIIKEQFRSDDIVGRIGGDEFLVVMKDSTVDKALSKAERLCRVLEKEYTGGPIVKKISASIGLSVSGVDGNDYGLLFEKADRAMYRAKKSGKASFKLAEKDEKGPAKETPREHMVKSSFQYEDKEFLVWSMNMLTHAKNSEASLNMLLQKLSNEYNLTMVAVCEETDDTNSFTLSNYYSNALSFYEKVVFADNVEIIKEIQEGDVVEVESAKIDTWIRDGLETKGGTIMTIKDRGLAAVSKFRHIGEKNGIVFFFSMEPDRKWTESEFELFREITRIISLFISLRHRMDDNKAAIRKIQRRDRLTGLHNFEAFKNRFRLMSDDFEDDKVYAVQYLDIDNFGYINENYGYEIGDNVLKFFATDYKSQDFYMLGCRIYSDFFVILIKGDSKEEILNNIEKQNNRFTKVQNHQYPSSSLAISTGIYFIEKSEPDVETAIENANMAWKVCKKNNNKNKLVIFDDNMRTNRVREQQIIGEFYEALYRDDFKLYLQPKFYLDSQQVYGAEALTRWRKPDGTIWAPFQFMELIEKIGYITELDFYIFEQTVKTIAKWEKEGKRDMVVSVNFSGHHFEGDVDEFVNRINAIIHKYKVSPSKLELELTEGVMVRNRAELSVCLLNLQAQGFRIAIDDFGTGYSSLAVLTEMPSDVVKIDKSFLDSSFQKGKIDMIIEIGRMIDIAKKEIIFEGIETMEQCEALSKEGFKYGQGYLINKPIPCEEFEELYLAND